MNSFATLLSNSQICTTDPGYLSCSAVVKASAESRTTARLHIHYRLGRPLPSSSSDARHKAPHTHGSCKLITWMLASPMLFPSKSTRYLICSVRPRIFSRVCLYHRRPFSSLIMTPSEPPPSEPKKRSINLLRGWPSPHVLPAEALKAAANKVLSDPDIFIPGLLSHLEQGGPSRLSPCNIGGTYSRSIRSSIWTRSWIPASA